MTIDEAIQKLDSLIEALDTALKNISETAALDAIALIITRVQTEGIGQKYSANKVPAYLFLLGGGLNLDTKQTRTFVEGVVKRKDKEQRFTNWAEIREAHGNQSNFVDLTFTGDMFRRTQIIDSKKIGEYWVTTIGGLDKETENKLRWNAQRYGDFFVLTKDEQDLIEESIKSQVTQVLNLFTK